MPFGLPARDEANWDTKLNDSINAVKATADAAETPAGAQAKADAAAAASIPLAQKNAASGVAPLDAGSLVPQANLPAHLTPAELSATYGPGIAAEPVATTARLLDQAGYQNRLLRPAADTRLIRAKDLDSTSGSPSYSATGGGSRFGVWLLDAATLEQVTVVWEPPPGWLLYDAVLLYTNAGAGAGNVSWSYTRSVANVGDSLSSGDTGTTSFTEAAPAQNVVKSKTLYSAVTASPGLHHIRIARTGADASDTLANDVGVLGVEFRRRAPGIRLVGDGNSLMLGQGATVGQDPLQQLKTLLTESADDRVLNTPVLLAGQNFAVGGQQTTAMMADAAAQVDAVISAAGTYSAQVLLVWEGTNDMWVDGDTAATAYANLRSYHLAREAAGWQTLVMTVLPRSNTGTPSDFEDRRQALNALLRANWPAFASGIVDVAADPRIGPEGAELDTTYYDADKVHMNDAGYAVVAELAKAAVLRLPGGN